MADRAAPLIGSFQKITLGTTSRVVGAGKYSYSGFTRKTVDISEFGVDIDIFDFGSADGGTVSISDAAFDPSSIENNLLVSYAQTPLKMIRSLTTGIRFWLNSTSWMTIGSSGNLLITSGLKVDADRSGVAKTSFEMKVSGDYMVITA